MTAPAEGLVTRRSGRAGRLARALAFGLTHGEASVVALAGFLLRGGIVLLALPSVILPSVIGIASVTGVDAISIAGQPTTWLVELIALAIVAAIAWLAVASLVGSLTDVWLIQMTLDPSGTRQEAGKPAAPARVASAAAGGDPNDLPGATCDRACLGRDAHLHRHV